MLVQTREITDSWRRIRSHWVLIRGNQATHIGFEHALYSGRELVDLLQQAGFGKVKLFGSWQGEPYDPNARRLIAVTTKPA